MKIQIRHSVDRFIEAVRRAPDIVMGEVDRTILRVAIEGARVAKREAPKSLSELVNSIRNEQAGVAFHRIIADAPHARFVEEGTGPGGRPPMEAIRRWIRLAQIQPREGRSERDLAFLIARAIARRGTRAQPYMAPAREFSIQRLQQLLPEAMRAATERALS